MVIPSFFQETSFSINSLSNSALFLAKTIFCNGFAKKTFESFYFYVAFHIRKNISRTKYIQIFCTHTKYKNYLVCELCKRKNNTHIFLCVLMLLHVQDYFTPLSFICQYLLLIFYINIYFR